MGFFTAGLFRGFKELVYSMNLQETMLYFNTDTLLLSDSDTY